ncbi:MAG: hypothetical protein IKW28_08805 [Lachnospiraceae bacterium]|nr:hypothetical protein [Lachnospiraceae bacterium]
MENNYIPKSRLVLRILAGGYLIYLGIDLITTLKEQTISPIISIGCALLFMAVGAVLLFFSLRSMKNGEFKEAMEEKFEAQEKENKPAEEEN